MIEINKIIIWGLRDSRDTMKFVMEGFFRAWKYLNYNVYWVNSIEELEANNIDFSKCVVWYAQTGTCPTPPPIKKDNFYVCHNADDFEKKVINTIGKQYYLKHSIWATTVLNEDDISLKRKHSIFNISKNMVIFPWATNLLPYEIDENMKNLENVEIKPTCGHVGSAGGHWGEPYRLFAEELKKYKIPFSQKGPDSTGFVPENVMVDFLKSCIIVPSLQFKWQRDVKYVPCRLFKSISYGKMGITNNMEAHKFFDEKLLYSDNLKELAKMSVEFEKNPKKNEIIKDLMINVRDNHTYVSRINLLICVLKEYKDITFEIDINDGAETK